MNFNGSGGLMLLIIAGLWVGVFVPSWFKRSEDRQVERSTAKVVRGEIRDIKKTSSVNKISSIAEQNYRLTLTRRIFTTIAFFALAATIASIYGAVSQIFYWIVTFIFSTIFVVSIIISRAAKRKSKQLLSSAVKTRSSNFATNYLNGLKSEVGAVNAGIPVDTRAWQPNPLPAPKQRIGELESPTLAEVVEIDLQVIKNAPATLDSRALDEILRRRRANG
jgi:hypothetical protein